MSDLFEVADGVSGYPRYVEHVLARSLPREARGLPTRDAGWQTVLIHDVSRSLPLGVGRRVSRRVAALEGLQLVGGCSDPQLLADAAPFFGELTEPSGRFHGAYGDRVGPQLAQAVGKLRADPGTRQAVVTLWDPWLDNQPGKKDYPCTVALGFDLWRGRLDMCVTMRSQDVWLGTPYDWFQFSLVLTTMARSLEVEPGRHLHTTWSTHIYERDLPKIADLTDPPAVAVRELQPTGVGAPGDTFFQLARRARTLIYDDVPGMTESERTLRDWLTS